MNLEISILIVLCSISQSLFGVGILIFGTPVMLIMQYSYVDILWVLLPCSISINFMQILGDAKNKNIKSSKILEVFDVRSLFFKFTIPFIILGLVFVLIYNHNINLKKSIGILMLLTSILRGSSIFRIKVQQLFKRFQVLAFSILGIIHGLTNMGGSILSVIISSIYNTKDKIRVNIAFAYLIMASIQLLVLVLFKIKEIQFITLLYVLISLTIYKLIGNKLYSKTKIETYNLLMTYMIGIIGLVMVVI